MEDKKIKYLEFIENVIERMPRSSFMLKGWAITVFAGVLTLADTDHIFVPLIATIVTTVMFWYLDSFYLQQERLYRSLYDKARATSNNDIDFSLKATQDEFPSKRNTAETVFIQGLIISAYKIGFRNKYFEADYTNCAKKH